MRATSNMGKRAFNPMELLCSQENLHLQEQFQDHCFIHSCHFAYPIRLSFCWSFLSHHSPLKTRHGSPAPSLGPITLLLKTKTVMMSCSCGIMRNRRQQCNEKKLCNIRDDEGTGQTRIVTPSITVLPCLLQAWADSAGLQQAGQGCNRWRHNACLASA